MDNPSEEGGKPIAVFLDRYKLLGKGVGPVAQWEAYDLSHDHGNRTAINKRVLKYTNLTNNLIKMMDSVHHLYLDRKYQWSFGPEVEILASRLTWIMLYFYGAMQHYSSWISGQTEVVSMAQSHDPDWKTFLQSLGRFFFVLANLPKSWLSPGRGVIINDTEHQQVIPTEAPLELVTEIYLIVHDAVNPLMNPDAVQDTLRQFAVENNFPVDSKSEMNDGFSNCIFITQSKSSGRNLTVGSTVTCMRYVSVPALTKSFAILRRRRFIQGPNRHDNELKARFRNEPDTKPTTPEKRYQDVRYTELAEGVRLVRTRLIDEYAGREPAPVAPGQAAVVLPPADRKRWEPFSYVGQHARSYFAPIVYANQPNWFEPTARCLKCRIIHDYNIVDENLQAPATANNSCQCAEDIVYVKLRQSDRVGNVVLANL